MKEAMMVMGRSQTVKRTVPYQELRREIEACAALTSIREPENVPRTLAAWDSLFDVLAQHASTIDGLINSLSPEQGATEAGELRFWAHSLISQTREFSLDLKTLAPWALVRSAHGAAIGSEYDEAILRRWANLTELLEPVPAISSLPEASPRMLDELKALRAQMDKPSQTTVRGDHPALLSELDVLASTVEAALESSKNLLSLYARLARQSEAIGETVDLHALFDEEHKDARNFYPGSKPLAPHKPDR
jgi:hypothetical protein